jgi:hypothetical protein
VNSGVCHAQFPSLPKIDPPKLPRLPGQDPKPADGAAKPKQGGKKGDAARPPAAPAGDPAPADRPEPVIDRANAGEAASARPAFAALVTDAVRAALAEFPPEQAATIESLLGRVQAADRGPAPLQLSYAQTLVQLFEQYRTTNNLEGKTPQQIAAIKVAQERAQRGESHPFTVLVTELKSGSARLKKWISEDEVRSGITLNFAAKGGVGRAEGLRTLPWGPIAGWSDNVIRIAFDDGLVFERQAATETIPLALRNAFVAAATESTADAPPIDAIAGDLAVFISERPIEGAEGVKIVQRMLVVDGALSALVTAMVGGEGVLEAGKTMWAAVQRDLGPAARVTETFGIEGPLSSTVVWSTEKGVVAATVGGAKSEAQIQALVLQSSEYEFAPSSCTALLVDRSAAIGVSEYVRDLDDATAEERQALVPGQGSRVIIIAGAMVGADRTKFCQPKIFLKDEGGKRYEDVGDHGRHPVLMGLRGNRINKTGSGAGIPFDLPLTTLMKLSAGDSEGIAESHGDRARVFYVPASVGALTVHLDGCDRSLPLPAIAFDSDWMQAPIRLRESVEFAKSRAATDPQSVCILTRQWSAAAIARAAKDAEEAAARATRDAANAKAAADEAESKRRQKLESSFD